MDGKAHGQWVYRYWSGAVFQSSYVDGKEHGEFYGEQELCGSREASLKVSVRGKYMDGKKQGYWQNDRNYPTVDSGRYDEDGLRQGTWILRGYTCREAVSARSAWYEKIKGDYIDGKREGTWLEYVQWDWTD